MENRAFQDENGMPMKKSNGDTGNGLGHTDVEAAMEVYKKKMDDQEAVAEEEDPWKVMSLVTQHIPWSELTTGGKLKRVLGYIIRVILVLGFLYLFICSLDFLSSAFKLLGGEAAGKVFQRNDIMSNPFAGLMMGVLVTVLVQSSSTSTSIIVSMVSTGLLKIKTAIPIVMGANIGTSVTNTIVAIGQISDKDEFRRAFAGATVHDMFNCLAVLVLLPLEVATDYLFHLSEAVVNQLPLETDKEAKKDILKVITKPFTERIVQVNKKAITNIAKNEDDDKPILHVCCDAKKKTPADLCKAELGSFSFIQDGVFYTDAQKTEVCDALHTKAVQRDGAFPESCLTSPWTYTHKEARETVDCTQLGLSDNSCCVDALAGLNFTSPAGKYAESEHISGCEAIKTSCFSTASFNMTTCMSSWNTTEETSGEQFSCSDWTHHVENKTCNNACDHLFMQMYPQLSDKAMGGILLVISIALLCICLVAIVKLLHGLLKGPIALVIKKFINADFPGYAAYFTGYLAILIGAGLTFVVQSSSIFTSSLTPLVGIGVIELDRMYPLTLGANIGTTTTAILSALANTGGSLRNGLQIAFCHLFFNITGIFIFYPLPFFRPPIPMAKFLGNRTANYRWFAIVYILFMFFILPSTVFGLSLAGWEVLVGVFVPIVFIILVVVVIKVLQAKFPNCLPTKMQNWKFLPLPLRSLEPYDRLMLKVFFCKRFKFADGTEGQKETVDVKNVKDAKDFTRL